MAFNITNLNAFSNNARTGVVPALWEYYNESDDTITTAGYFPLHCGIRANDRVMVLTTTLTDAPKWYYAIISGNQITLEKCDEIAISDLDDVAISELEDGEVLTYDGTSQKWENKELPEES